MKLITVIGRFFVRLWHAHRNQAIVKAHKWLGKALVVREQILKDIPEDRREEVISADPVLSEARDMAYKLTAFFKLVGVQYEK